MSAAIVTLGRSEARRLADVIKPFVAQHATRELASQALHVTDAVLKKAVSGRAGVAFRRETLERLGQLGGIDVTGWGVVE